MDSRILVCTIIIIVFMAVTVGHVANYAGGFEADGWQVLGWPYALAVDAAIAACAWLTRWVTTRRWAWVGYFAFTLASGAMNAAAIEPWALPFPHSAFAWIYALFPTAAIGLLGFLAQKAGRVAELGKGRRKGAPIAAKVPQPIARVAQVSDWREIVRGLDGQKATVDARLAASLVQERGLELPSERTLQGWAQRAREDTL